MYSFFRILYKISGLAIFLSCIVISALVYKSIQDLPTYDQLASYYPNSVNRIYSSDGILIEEFGKEHRIFVPIENMPKALINAFIAVEDHNFYTHQGIDFLGILRAIFSNVKNIIQNRRLEGGSTITQQVVKNLILTPERSLTRKIKEAILSYKISKTFSKDQILEIYLNQIYLGEGAYGVASAAYNYFSKSIDELTIAEASTIAGLPKAPSRDNPIRNYDKAVERRNLVLARMYEENYITKEELEKNKLEKINIRRPKNNNNTVYAPYYAQTIKKKLEELLHPDLLEKGGLSIFTTMNSNYQKEAEKALIKTIRNYGKIFGGTDYITHIEVDNWKDIIKTVESPLKLTDLLLGVIIDINQKDNFIKVGLQSEEIIKIPISNIGYKINKENISKKLHKGYVIALEKIGDKYSYCQIPKIDGAIIGMEPHNGYVLFEVGGYSFKNSQFNRATSALRQIGSLVKTFIYHGAFEYDIPPNEIFEDKRIEIWQKGIPDPWVPKNWYTGYNGAMTLRKAFERSVNTVTVQITQRIGLKNLREIIKRFNIDKNPPNAFAISLGAVESTLEKVTSSYSVFANEGKEVTPIYIQFIQDRKGNIIYTNDSSKCMNCKSSSTLGLEDPPVLVEKNPRQITDKQSVYQTLSLLTGATKNGTAKKVSQLSC